MAEHGSGLNPGESNPPSERDATRSQDAGADTPMLFEFVTNDGNNRSQIRRHAMRESWRQRNRGQSNSPITRTPPRQRELLPRDTHSRENSSSAGQGAEFTDVSDIEMGEDARRSDRSSEDDMRFARQIEKRDDGLLTRDGIYLDLRCTIAPKSESSSAEWSLSTVPSCSGQRPSPYQSIGGAETDPFDTVRLSQEDKKLLHHCKPNTLITSDETRLTC
jgi:hypothetical protein